MVRMEPKAHRLVLSSCKANLIGRIMLRPGSKPMKIDEIQLALQKIWQPSATWKLTPLARGFFICILMMKMICVKFRLLALVSHH